MYQYAVMISRSDQGIKLDRATDFLFRICIFENKILTKTDRIIEYLTRKVPPSMLPSQDL